MHACMRALQNASSPGAPQPPSPANSSAALGWTFQAISVDSLSDLESMAWTLGESVQYFDRDLLASTTGPSGPPPGTGMGGRVVGGTDVGAWLLVVAWWLVVQTSVGGWVQGGGGCLAVGDTCMRTWVGGWLLLLVSVIKGLFTTKPRSRAMCACGPGGGSSIRQ